MSKQTELEKLREKIMAAKEAYERAFGIQLLPPYVMQGIDDALAAEKQRVCANCEHSEKSIRALYGLDTCPMAFDIMNECRELDPQGYCHKFTPRPTPAAPQADTN